MSGILDSIDLSGSFHDIIRNPIVVKNQTQLVHPTTGHENCSGEFTVKLLQSMMTSSPTPTFVVSPYLLQTSLGMCVLGSDASTKKELTEFIFPWSSNIGNYLGRMGKLASHVDSFYSAVHFFATHRAEVYAAYKKKIREVFGRAADSLAIVEVDFEKGDLDRLGEKIDLWFDKKLGGVRNSYGVFKPEGLVDKKTRLLITQAFAYKTEWREPFRSSTKDIFYKSADNGVLIDFMTQQGAFRYGDTDKFQILRKETSTKSVSFYFVLPRDCRGITINDIRDWRYNDLMNWFKSCSLRNMTVVLPKFHMEESWRDYAGVIQKLNVIHSFKKMRATFCHMARVCDLENGFEISKLDQKYAFRFDEGDTDEDLDADVNSTSVQESELSADFTLFKADRPFMFFMVLDDGANMFIALAGCYSGPGEN